MIIGTLFQLFMALVPFLIFLLLLCAVCHEIILLLDPGKNVGQIVKKSCVFGMYRCNESLKPQHR